MNDDNRKESQTPKAPARRKFLGQVGLAATAAAGALAHPAAASVRPAADSAGSAGGGMNKRVAESFDLRVQCATRQAEVHVPPHTTNGDEHRYLDKIGTHTKALLQDGPCRVNLDAYDTFKTALTSGKFTDFQKITMGGTATLNDPQGGLAFYMEGTDSGQFGNGPSAANQEKAAIVPPPPALASAAYGTELIELYWASLLRDVPFTDYPTSALAAQAAEELSGQRAYAGPRAGGQVTPAVLFRGGFPGETVGPYVSQFFITPTALGQQAISQQLTTYVAGVDYMTDPALWFDVQNGIATGIKNQNDPTLRYGYTGRVLAAYTHVDVLYQAYFTALLVMGTLAVPPNPGNPYIGSKTENGFATFGAPDYAASLGEAASCALKAVWYQKWFVHLRHRPEAGGGIVHVIKTGQGSTLDGTLNGNVLNSQAVAASYAKYGTYLLSQTYPEGSPTHPAYPTGHGVVGGACITMLKFFYDGNHVIANPMVPSDDGTGLVPYTGSDAGQITVNGELNKLGHNISFGHGIHAGVHWRSDTDSSLMLGEAVAISLLRDKVLTYNEPVTVQITKFDGTTATISNQ
jgi:hypothetical protein